MVFFRKFILFLLFFSITCAFSQVPYPLIQKYINLTPDAASQNWDIITGKNGFLYVANSSGLLLFNGKAWSMLNLPNSQAVRCLYKTQSGKFYVGGQGEIGYLKTDDSGKLKYVSLNSLIPYQKRKFKDVWNIYYQDSIIYVQSSNKIMIKKARQDSFVVFSYPNRIHRSFLVHSIFYDRIHQKGLFYYNGNKFVKAPNGNYFADKQILAMFPHGHNIYLVTRKEGILDYDPESGKIKPMKLLDELSVKFAKNLVFKAIQLQNKDYAFATLQNGIILTDSLFKIKIELNLKSGLSDNMVLQLFEDKSKNLWAATGNGLSYILLNSNFTTIDKNIGFEGVAYTSLFFKNHFYIGGSNGLSIIDKSGYSHSKEFINQLWNLQIFNGKLYGSYRSDLIEIQDNKILNSSQNRNIWKIIKPLGNAQMLLGTYTGGMVIYERGDKSWDFKSQIKGFDGSVRFTEVDSLGNVWIADAGAGIYKVNIDYSTDSIVEKHFYDKAKGLPEDENNYVFKITDFGTEKIVFATMKGIYRYDFNSDSIIPYREFQVLLGNKETDLFSQDSSGNIWYQSYADKAYFHGFLEPQRNGKYLKNDSNFFKFKDLYIENYTFSNGYTIMNTSEGLFFYKALLNKPDYSFKTVITEFSADTSIFYLAPGKINYRYEIPEKPTSVKFSFGALFLEDYAKIMYRYKLDGYDKKWSVWSSLKYKEYTNLSPGHYDFSVEAKNIYQKKGKISHLTFTIDAAWYQSKWMYPGYFVFLALLIWFIVKIYTYKLKQDKVNLEILVAERTEEINQQKEELIVIAENLKEANSLILDKNENLDFANVQINKRNRQIMESINYAQTIQSALLPSTATLDSVFSDNFILFMPKDIVSGDFYWIRDFENHTVIIAADSTGHGVPGGFMSMLGIAFLNEIIVSEYYLKADLILDTLRNKVKNVFNRHNKTGEQQNGMDLALIIYDKKRKEIEFSGANNPVFVVKANGKVILIKGERQPIGNYRKEIPFTSQKLQLEQNDWIYLYSDGYQDQIGELSNMRIKSQPFRNRLLAEAKFVGREQKEHLQTEFSYWRGKNVQMDDILIIGLKV